MFKKAKMVVRTLKRTPRKDERIATCAAGSPEELETALGLMRASLALRGFYVVRWVHRSATRAVFIIAPGDEGSASSDFGE